MFLSGIWIIYWLPEIQSTHKQSLNNWIVAPNIYNYGYRNFSHLHSFLLFCSPIFDTLFKNYILKLGSGDAYLLSQQLGDRGRGISKIDASRVYRVSSWKSGTVPQRNHLQKTKTLVPTSHRMLFIKKSSLLSNCFVYWINWLLI